MRARSEDVLVIGGGLIGLGIAWRAALAGLPVSVVDQAPTRGASWVGAGLLAPVTEVHYGEEPLLELNLASASRFPSFVAELEELTGQDTGYRENGLLVVAKDRDDQAGLDELHRYQQKLGLEVERLSGRECREREPMLAPDIRGGLLVGGDHQVDTRRLAGALLEACRRSGVRLVAEMVTDLRVESNRITGVELGNGQEEGADRVVLAAGCWSAQIGGVGPEVAPVRPVKGQLLQLRGPADFLHHNLRAIVKGSDVYVANRGDGRLVAGATVEEMGFDTGVTAGAVYTILRDLSQVLPGVWELELTETLAGLRPGSPDNAPLLGPAGPDGLVVATGHYRNGILLTPITADTITELLSTGRVPELIGPFSPARFQREGS